MEKKDNSLKGERNYDIVDPLGEIRRYAKKLWVEAGRPEEKDWSHFFDEAESLLVGGRSGGVSSGRTKDSERVGGETPVSPRIAAVIARADGSLACILASALQREIGAHDAVCLAIILDANEITLADGRTIGPFQLSEIAQAVAEVAHEYDTYFLNLAGASSVWSVPLPERVSYWTKRVQDMQSSDRPLSYHDLNTITRLEGQLKQHGVITKLTNRSGLPELK